MTVQHAQIPQILTKKKLPKRLSKDENPVLQQGDKVVYGVIRMHMDDSRTCYPSIATIKMYAHCGQKFVEESIARLIKAGFMELSKIKLKNGKWSNLYRFPETEFDKTFDMFTIDFLKMNLPIHLKEYIMDLQSGMYEKESGIGKVSYANLTIENKTGWSQKDIEKFDKLLCDMNALSKIPSGKIDQAGFPIMIREFDLTALNQAKLWIKAVNEQLATTQNYVEEVDNKVNKLESNQYATNAQIKAMQKEINMLTNRVSKYESILVAHGINPEIDDKNFPFD